MPRLRHGTNPHLEAEADRMIKQSLAGVTAHSEKKDVLTPWKEQDRRSREVYVASGVPDSSARQGVFTRAANPSRPHLNSREGVAQSKVSSLTRHMAQES